MAELNDYSGPFNPSIQYEDFSKEMMVKLLKEYQRAYLIVLGEWHRVMRERFDEITTQECDISQWMLSGPLVSHFLSRALNIKVGDVESCFKALQLDPGFPMKLFDIEWELVNPNHGFITVNKCTALSQNEKAGTGYELPMCHVEEPPTFLKTALYHNPNMKFKPVKLPPRKNPDDIACKWEARIEPETGTDMQKTAGSLRFGIPVENGGFGQPWTEDNVIGLWGLLHHDTKEVLRIIARQPEGCSKDALVNGLGVDIEEISHSLGLMYITLFDSPWRAKQAPVRLCKDTWSYEMDIEFSQVVNRLPK
ncbi:hypothetical protein ACFLX5_01240 [Chloroflexota bacterium]